MKKGALEDAYEAIEILKGLKIPVSGEQFRNIRFLEKEYIEESIIETIKKDFEPFFKYIRSDCHISITYTPNVGVEVSMNNSPSYITRTEDGVSHRDNTKYSLNGGLPLKKRRFVLATIKKYVEDHPESTFNDLENRFPSSLSNNSLNGVVRRYYDIEKRAEKNPDLLNRFMMKPDEIITLRDGTKIVVYNQWGSHFSDFLKVAKQLYEVKAHV